MEELWKKLEEDYYVEISNIGRVRNIKTGKVLKPGIDRYGYYKLNLRHKGKVRYVTIHRLVGMTWLPNPENKPQINHLNGIKTDNRVENLQWSTARENVSHSYDP